MYVLNSFIHSFINDNDCLATVVVIVASDEDDDEFRTLKKHVCLYWRAIVICCCMHEFICRDCAQNKYCTLFGNIFNLNFYRISINYELFTKISFHDKWDMEEVIEL